MARLPRKLDSHQIRSRGPHATLTQSHTLPDASQLVNAMHVTSVRGHSVPTPNRRQRRFITRLEKKFGNLESLNKILDLEGGVRKRSVNMYILYRAYLKGLVELSALQQKDASPILAVLWDREIFKSKWAILARAFTLIRDAGAARSVDEFLAIAAPRIGIIPVAQYLSRMNWLLEIRENQETQKATVILRQTSSPLPTQFPPSIAHTNMTDLDIITFCADQGYLPVGIAAGITVGWSQMDHPMAQLASQGSFPATNHIATTQNAYGHFQLPFPRNGINPREAFPPAPAPAYSSSLPDPQPQQIAAAAAAAAQAQPQLTPSQMWPPTDGGNMMAGWWDPENGPARIEELNAESAETYDPVDLSTASSFDSAADNLN